MKKIKVNILTISMAFLLPLSVFAQEEWIVPDKEKENISIFTFDDEMINSGAQIYNNSCSSCHGVPTKADYTPMVPSPGDVSEERFQKQSDGALFYKILKGRGSMPAFEDALAEDEIWSLIAYFRSFNEDYVQPVANMEGIEIPVLALEYGYDDNVDKLVVKVIDDSGNPVSEASVSAFVQGYFGRMLLSKEKSNDLGIAYFDVDSKLPGDLDGVISVYVKASKGYGSVKGTQQLAMAQPTIPHNAIEGRHLWSVANKTPIWLIVIFLGTLGGIWSVIVYILFGLRKIKKLN